MKSRSGHAARVTGALAPLAALLALGCQVQPPLVHPRFADFQPAVIAVPPVENRTLLDLARVSSAGLLQRVTLGAAEVDVPETLRGGLLEAARKKGYVLETRSAPGTPDLRRPLPAGSTPPFDAVLFAEITEFNLSGPASDRALSLGGAVELVRVGDEAHGGGEVLYRKDFHRTSGPGRGAGSVPARLEEEVRRAGLAALAELPPAGSRPPPPPAATTGPPRAAAANPGSR